MIDARSCKFQMKEKLSLKISRISSLFWWMLLPVHSIIPRISVSDKVWSKPLKCSATGKSGDFFSMLLRCSPKRSRTGSTGFPDVESRAATARDAVN